MSDVLSPTAATTGTPNSIEPIYLHLSITDPETVAALGEASEGRERQDLALTALKIGILSLKAARGTVDGAAVRNEGERLLGTLEERFARHRELLDESMGATLRGYFDPASGSFNERVQRLLRHDGELAGLISTQVDAARRTLDQLLAAHMGEWGRFAALFDAGEGNAFLNAIRAQTVQALQAQGEAIVAEFSLDRADSALSRLVAELKARHGEFERQIGARVASVVDEFSLDRDDTALSRLVARVESAQAQIGVQLSLDHPGSGLNRLVEQLDRHQRVETERAREFETRVVGLLERLATRRDEARRSTIYGGEFEAAVGARMRGECTAAGDVFEAVGAQTGCMPRSKVGDFVVTLGPDAAAAGARIVVEAKASQACGLKATLAEADEARRNRDASVCLFVHSAQTAPAGIADLHRWGSDVVVVWDAEDPLSDVRLKAGLLVAKALAIRAVHHTSEEAASFAAIDASVEAIRKQIQGFEEIERSSQTVINSGGHILKRAQAMRAEIDKRLEVLISNAARLKQASSAAA